MQLNKAVFINLDNTLVKTKSGEEYFKNVDDWKFWGDGLLQKLKQLVEKGYIPCIVSNQGGVGLGRVTEADVVTRMKKIEQELETYLGVAVNTAYCTSYDSYYRKPFPGMAYHFALNLALSLRNSIMIGNSNNDSGFAKNAYIGTYYDIEDFLKDSKIEEL